MLRNLAHRAPLRVASGLVVLCGAICSCGTLLAIRLLPGEEFSTETLAVAGTTFALAVGGTILALERLLTSPIRIANQLGRLAGDVDPAELAPVSGIDPTAHAWNDLVDHVQRTTSLSEVANRLRESIGGLKRRECDIVLDSLPDGVAVTAGRVLRFSNQAFTTLLRIESEEINGRSIEQFLKLAPADLEKLVGSDRPVVVESPLGASPVDGILRISRHPMRDTAGGTATHVWTVRDITQQKLAEAMRDNFVSSATHELRTPLANIKAYSETLAMLDAADVERQKEFCNIIDSEVTRLSRFVDDLLSIDQMESGALSLIRHETDLGRLVGEVCEKVKPQMDGKRIVFETHFPKKFPKLQLDKDKFAAALVNLLGNAAKYTPEEGTVRLVVERMEEGLRFHVEDTGIGIAPEELEHVFDKFFRSDDDRVRDISGNGLGLAFTREVVRLHGGDVTVHSELDKGSRFTVTLAG